MPHWSTLVPMSNAKMIRLVIAGAMLLVLSGCAGVQQAARDPSPCDVSESSYECQVDRYNHVGHD